MMTTRKKLFGACIIFIAYNIYLYFGMLRVNPLERVI